MALEDRIARMREESLGQGREPVPDTLQGVDKERVRAVLAAIDRNTNDIVDTVFALLDDTRSSWFPSATLGTKFSEGASTAHIACHVGILQRGARKLDREGRDYWIKPLRELGAIEPVYLNPGTGEFIHGHVVAKSANCAYRLADDFKEILQAPAAKWKEQLKVWASEERIRQRAEFQATMAEQSRRQVDTKHSDLIRASQNHYVGAFLPGYEVIYIDDGDSDRITDQDRERLAVAGLEIRLDDAMPDILLWNQESDWLWVVEAVTSDGEVDAHKQKQLQALAERHGKAGIGFTTTYARWKDLAARQGRHKNLAIGTYVWIQEDPSRQLRVDESPGMT